MMHREWTERERLVVAVGAGIGAVLLIVLLVTPYLNALEQIAVRAERARTLIASLERIGPEVSSLRSKLGRGTTGSTRPVSATVLMENTAARTGLRDRLVSLRPQSAPATGRVAESLEVEVEKVQLAELVRWLYAIDRAPGAQQVTQLRLRKRFDNRELFDVTLLLVRYRSEAP